ncbi:flavodoxin family protein [Candidatus Aerophobetes bacterium]|nr:flavodoxin family protein [Candidatus Aerophobetes bacterium]
MKKALLIYGSPRKDGNTDILLKEIVRGIKDGDEKINVEEIYLRKLCIFPCRECRSCEVSGRCVVDDDMQKLYPKLKDADYIILGSPIFFYSVSAQTKALIDRAQALWARKYLLGQDKKKKEKRQGWFVAVGATKGKKLFEGSIFTLKYFFDALNISLAGELLIRGVDGKGEVLNYPEHLSRAYKLGKEMVS